MKNFRPNFGPGWRFSECSECKGQSQQGFVFFGKDATLQQSIYGFGALFHAMTRRHCHTHPIFRVHAGAKTNDISFQSAQLGAGFFSAVAAVM